MAVCPSLVHNRRPLVIREQPTQQVLWGQRHVVQSLNILFGQLTSGKFQHLAESPALQRALGELANRKGHEFEDRVAETLRARRRYAVKQDVRRLGEDPLQRANGQTLGNIDVLVGDPKTRRLWAIECKDLHGGLSTAEVVREMTEHFRQAGTTSVTKHLERVEWLREHSDAALELLEIDSSAGEDWKVEGLIVTGRLTMAPHIDDVPFEVVAVDDLVAFLENFQTA